MKYVRPQELEESKIDKILSDENESFESKVSVLISSLYYSIDNGIILNRLLNEFKKSNNDEKASLLNLFETSYDMRRTSFNVDESINTIKEFLKENPDRKDRIDDCLSTLRHCKKIYSQF